jgi:hypothetical protein
MLIVDCECADLLLQVGGIATRTNSVTRWSQRGHRHTVPRSERDREFFGIITSSTREQFHLIRVVRHDEAHRPRTAVTSLATDNGI